MEGINTMKSGLSAEQRNLAIQRLTALWAFTESGLGGILHAFQSPFTGLVVGGLAIILICLIAQFSDQQYNRILQSLLVVLIVKATVSPYTPFTAYIAVSFQAVLAWLLFRFLRINPFTVLLLAVITMIESAIQHLLVLTLFFGSSLWVALNSLVNLVAREFGWHGSHNSAWIISIYLAIYVLGGIFTGIKAWQMISNYRSGPKEINAMPLPLYDIFIISPEKQQHIRKQLLVYSLILFSLSVVLFVFSANSKQGWMAVLKTFSYTTVAIMLWYLFISPLFTRLIKQYLKKKEYRYSAEVAGVLSFLPVLRQLSSSAWKESTVYRGRKRWNYFLSLLIHWSLTCSEQVQKEML